MPQSAGYPAHFLKSRFSCQNVKCQNVRRCRCRRGSTSLPRRRYFWFITQSSQREAGTRDEPLRTSAWQARVSHARPVRWGTAPLICLFPAPERFSRNYFRLTFPTILEAWNRLLHNTLKEAHEKKPVACKWDKRAFSRYVFSQRLSIFHSATKERWLLSQFPTEYCLIFLLLTARSPTTSESLGFPLTRDLCFLTTKCLPSVSKKMLIR